MIIHRCAWSYNRVGISPLRLDGSHTWHTDRVIPGASQTKGRLLVATPPLEDPNFDRTVVYVLEHHDEGALGVVINRPGDEDLAEPLDRWDDLQAAPGTVFHGGPVEPDALIALALAKEPVIEATEELSPISGRVASADLTTDPALRRRPRRTRCGCSAGTPVGGRGNSRARSSRGRGWCSTPNPTTSSLPCPTISGGRFCAVRADDWPGSHRLPTISAPTDHPHRRAPTGCRRMRHHRQSASGRPPIRERVRGGPGHAEGSGGAQ